MYNPREINIKNDFTIQQKIDPGKVKIIVLDGNQGTAHVLNAPEHGKTVIQTVKGSFARVDHEIGYKVRSAMKESFMVVPLQVELQMCRQVNDS